VIGPFSHELMRRVAFQVPPDRKSVRRRKKVADEGLEGSSATGRDMEIKGCEHGGGLSAGASGVETSGELAEHWSGAASNIEKTGCEQSHCGLATQRKAKVEGREPPHRDCAGVMSVDNEMDEAGVTRGGLVCGALPHVPPGVMFDI
jgi:hypothetical protein